MAKRADYGVDAPGMVKSLAVWGLVCIAAHVAFLLLDIGPMRDIAGPLLPIGASLLLAAGVMLLSSKVLKFGVRDRVIEALALKGDESVLDVGCGRGLALIGAAKRLTTGQAVGIDLWSAADLSANSAEATLANAALEGVASRVRVDTGDARALPYADASFDAVTSMTALHNIKDAAGRARALSEMCRVLKPGGRLSMFDIFHPFSYRAVLRAHGIEPLTASFPLFLWAIPGVRLWGVKRG